MVWLRQQHVRGSVFMSWLCVAIMWTREQGWGRTWGCNKPPFTSTGTGACADTDASACRTRGASHCANHTSARALQQLALPRGRLFAHHCCCATRHTAAAGRLNRSPLASGSFVHRGASRWPQQLCVAAYPLGVVTAAVLQHVTTAIFAAVVSTARR